MSDERSLTVAEVAERLHAHPNTVRRWIRERKLRSFRLPGGDLRIKPEELKKFIGDEATEEQAGKT